MFILKQTCHIKQHVLLSLKVLPEPYQSALLDTLQSTTFVGELSAFDMEKYLKKTDVSDSSDASVAHTTFDLTSWADNLSSSQRNHHPEHPEEQGSSIQQVDNETQQKPTSTKTEEIDRRGETTLNTNSSALSLLNTLSAGDKADSKRSSIPRPCTSFGSARRSVGSDRSSTFKPPTEKMGASDNYSSSVTKSCGSSDRMHAENGVKIAELNPQAPNTTGSSLETSQKRDKNNAGLTRPPPGNGQSGQSGPQTQSGKSAGQQQQQDRPSNSPETKSPPRNIMASPLPNSSVEKLVGHPQPLRYPSSGE